MAIPSQPRLRRIESFPVTQPGGEVAFALRDPEGFSHSIVLPHAAAVLASLMDGSRTHEELRDDFARQCGQGIELSDVEGLVRQLDERSYLDTDTFRARWKSEIERYLNSPVRPPAHAGGAYSADPQALREQLTGLFTHEKGPGGPPAINGSVAASHLCGVMSPHIDLHRGGPAFAWAYKRVVEQSDADLFIILGTAHNPTRHFYGLTKKDYDTPLGTVSTDRKFVSSLAAKVSASTGGKDLYMFDELAHRQEHSIEFQAVFLQHLLGDVRPFKIVPVLVGSFHSFVASGESPSSSAEVTSFVEALRRTAAEHSGKTCYINGSDLAHIGQRFGDREFLDVARLKAQADDDQALLSCMCRGDAEAFFRHVAGQQDKNRICGLSPTYTMLQSMRPKRGELLRYDQAVELDGTSCVTFASAAFYDA